MNEKTELGDPVHKRPLSPKHRKVYEYIRTHIVQTGIAPSRAEIAENIGAGITTADWYVKKLEEKGWIKVIKHTRRGIVLMTGKPVPVVKLGQCEAEPLEHMPAVIARMFSREADLLVLAEKEPDQPNEIIAVRTDLVPRSGNMVLVRSNGIMELRICQGENGEDYGLLRLDDEAGSEEQGNADPGQVEIKGVAIRRIQSIKPPEIRLPSTRRADMQPSKVYPALNAIQSRTGEDLWYSWRKDGFYCGTQGLTDDEARTIRECEAMLDGLAKELVEAGLADSTSLYYDHDHRTLALHYDRFDVEHLVFGRTFTQTREALEQKDDQPKHPPGRAAAEPVDPEWEAGLREQIQIRLGAMDQWRDRLWERIDKKLSDRGWALGPGPDEATRHLLPTPGRTTT